MIRLGIHLDPVAVLRQAAGGREPDLLAAGHAAMVGGADHVIVCLHSDGRGANEADVRRLRDVLSIPLHVDIEATAASVALMKAIRPEHVCLVPRRSSALRSWGSTSPSTRRPRRSDAC